MSAWAITVIRKAAMYHSTLAWNRAVAPRRTMLKVRLVNPGTMVDFRPKRSMMYPVTRPMGSVVTVATVASSPI